MRKNGVMLHITSLPTPYGVGTMGYTARQFVDQLQRNGQSIWPFFSPVVGINSITLS